MLKEGPGNVVWPVDGSPSPAAKALIIIGGDDEGGSESFSNCLNEFADILLRFQNKKT